MKRRPTILDVARLAGVSKTTVSRVVNGDDRWVRPEVRRRVRQAIAELGYERNALAGGLRTGRTHTILLVLPDITNPFWPEVARGVQDALDAQGYATVLANSDWEERREREFLSMAVRNRFAGIIINPARISNDDLVASGIPTVVLGLGGKYPDLDMVGNDSFSGTALALQHLLDLGHERIGLINGVSRRSGGSSRLESYRQFFQERGLPVSEEWVVTCPYGQEFGYQSMKRLLRLDEPPTAVLAANDVLAIGALRAVQEEGLHVPDDISIVGMDDIYAVSVTTPPLTTVAKQKHALGWQAATFLLERMRHEAPEEPRRYRFPCYLVQRGSTAPPRSKLLRLEPAQRAQSA
ncbi:MAG: LacI family transcriptional regulator [Chloroflexi bacterium]|nr:LacI family transcriptional regulator [Chloroflexota bacterium]